MSRQKIAVIGGVASGPAAAAQACRVDPEAEVVLFEQGPSISYGACEIPYFVSGQIKALEDLVVLSPEAYTRTRGATVHVRHRVHSIDPRHGRLVVEDLNTGSRRTERYDKFILAVGAQVRQPAFYQHKAANVFAVRTLQDAAAIRAYLTNKSVRHAVIIGGGYIGLEMAEALHHCKVRVTVLESGTGVLASILDGPLQALLEEHLIGQGIQLRREQATHFQYDAEGTVQAVGTDRGEVIGCQMVLLAMGIEPRTDLAVQAGVRCGTTGALAVTEGMRTNVPTIWACGDCVEVRCIVDGKKIHHPLSNVAYRTAHVAGANAARKGRGTPERFEGVIPATAVRVFSQEVAAVGLSLAAALEAGFEAHSVTIRHWSRVSMMPGAKPLWVQLAFEKKGGRLLGGALLGEEGAALRANVLVPLIKERQTVYDLLDLNLIYTPPVAPARDPLLVAAWRAIKEIQRERNSR